MNKRNIAILLGVIILLTGCSVNKRTKSSVFPLMYEQRPQTILILPPINESTAPEAKEYFMSTLSECANATGYYFLPLEVTTPFLQSEGLYDTEIISDAVLPQFKEYFGADAVMTTKILEWNKDYHITGGAVSVAVEFNIRSTTTGDILWNYYGKVEVDTSSDDTNLLAAVIQTAISTAATDYVPIAQMVNRMVFDNAPVGQHHPRFNEDGDDELKEVKPKDKPGF
ncbi:MAG: DUF799 domain-containing protein [Candidatus Cloacimonetes bacterium]|nr:DUF799 domain-containing protein [Candidatus Cloacimonadota bacterium]